MKYFKPTELDKKYPIWYLSYDISQTLNMLDDKTLLKSHSTTPKIIEPVLNHWIKKFGLLDEYSLFSEVDGINDLRIVKELKKKSNGYLLYWLVQYYYNIKPYALRKRNTIVFDLIDFYGYGNILNSLITLGFKQLKFNDNYIPPIIVEDNILGRHYSYDPWYTALYRQELKRTWREYVPTYNGAYPESNQVSFCLPELNYYKTDQWRYYDGF